VNKLILIRGLPGSGKTTLIQDFFDECVISVCADDFFMINGEYCFDKNKLNDSHEWCRKQVEDHIIDNQALIAVHNTFTTEWEMQPYFKLAEEYNYQVSTIIVENRHGSKSVHNVPFDTLLRMKQRFQVKLLHEDYDSLVSIKEQNGLFIHKYKKKVFWNDLWGTDPRLKEARGLILDKQGNIVQYPFTKTFNYKERGVTIPLHHRVLGVVKINGFMAAVTKYQNEILISTTGSLISDFVAMAKEILPPITALQNKLRDDITYLFEIVHPNDPHIIDEESGAYLLAYREKSYGSEYHKGAEVDEMAKFLGAGIKTPNWIETTFEELLAHNRNFKKEGYFVYDLESKTILKLKSPWYLTNKFIARTKDLSKIWAKDYKQYFEEEVYPICEFLQMKYSLENFSSFDEQTRLSIIREFFNRYES
jgi:predicted kinase